MRQTNSTARWLHIVAKRYGKTVVGLARELRTPTALAAEIAAVFDEYARGEAERLIQDKASLPDDADWLTRRYYMHFKKEQDKKKAEEQARAWEEHMKLMGQG